MKQLKHRTVGLLSALALVLVFSTTVQAIEVGETAPCVVLNGIDAAGEDTRGCIRDQVNETQGFTLVEFFSVLCEDCQANLPIVSKLESEIREKATVRLVSIDPDEAEVREYVKDKMDLINFPVAFDVDRDAKSAYSVFLTPTLFLLDKENTVLFKHSGVLSPEDVAKIKELVGVETDGEIGVGDEAPCVVLDGLTSAGEETRGCIRDQEVETQKFTIMEFASITCSKCEENFPRISSVAKKLKKYATTRLVYVDPDAQEVKDYLGSKEEELLTFAVAFDTANDARKAYGIKKTPTLLVLDKDNKVVLKHNGILEKEDIKDIAKVVGALDDHEGGLQVGDLAPCVVLDGLSAKGNDTRGCIREPVKDRHDFTIVEFASITCSACNENLPRLSYLSRITKKVATTRAVYVNSDVSEVKSYVAEKSDLIRFPVAFDSEFSAAQAYDLQATPTLFVLNRDNEIVYKHVGVLSKRNIRDIAKTVGVGGGCDGGNCGGGGCD